MTRRIVTYAALMCTFFLMAAADAHGQKYPERGAIRKGNREYGKGRWEQSEREYMRALEKDPGSFEARYNLGNSLYRQGKWDEAESVYSQAAKAGATREDSFRTRFNSGNAMFQQRKLQEALEEYKEALRIDPTDMEAKFNLAYVKKLLEEQENDGGGGDDDQQGDDNDDQDQQGGGNDNNDGEGDPDQGEGDPDQGDNDNNDGDGNSGDKPDQGEGQGQRPPGMTREEAENLLDAMQGNEDRAREKAEEKKAGAVQRSEKNW